MIDDTEPYPTTPRRTTSHQSLWQHLNGYVATTRFYRRLESPLVKEVDVTVGDAGFLGKYYSRADAQTNRPAVLLIGGSEGGYVGPLGPVLASAGYPTLDVAYFKEPGLPKTLHSIPLEYFRTALEWLAKRPDIDPSGLYVLGASYGSQAAELLGVHYPDLVHGVIAGSPSNVSWSGLPGTSGPAWTYDGRAVPYTRQRNVPQPTDNPHAVIPVERIQGPIFLACGEIDRVWASCDYSHAIMSRLSTNNDKYTHILAEYPSAGHGVANFVPYDPAAWVGSLARLEGLSGDSNAVANANLWPRLLAFLKTTS